MYMDDDGRRPSLTPQLALRVAVMGGVALMAFALIFFRLWYLQVLSGDKYRAEANDNRVREIKVQAPRGEIVDRNGKVLVNNRTGLAVRVTPDKLPDDGVERGRLYERLGRVLDLPAARIQRSVDRQLRVLPYSPATVKQDVPSQLVYYLFEHQEDFPGVTVEQVFLREYPHHQVGAHLFGTVGEITKAQKADDRYRGVGLGDRVGQSGIEYQYDRFLRGRNGASRVQVDALGNLRGQLRNVRPQQGRQLRLSVDLDVQKAGQRAIGNRPGGFVAMNVNDGEVLALGSSPSFDPNQFSKAITPAAYKRLTSKQNGEPIVNRAIQSAYPTGSTFKLITASASLMGGLITPETVQYDPGFLKVGAQTFKNAGNAVNGAVALRKALSVSSDVFFYRLGQEANGKGDGLLIQKWARRLGLGRKTGIDLPGEAKGLVPSPSYRNRGFAAYQRCAKKRKPTPQQIAFGECGFLDRPWSVGDNVNLSVGQGDLAADPLQMAVAYASAANGGKIVRPRLGQRIEDSSGRPLQELETPPKRDSGVRPEFRQAILDGLRSAASDPGGTSEPVFKGFKIPVAGKTGTAEKGGGRADQSWYVALAPYPSPKYVVAVTIEGGGFGAEAAAPAAREIIAQLFGVKREGRVQSGTAPD
jgi:penicillin-binding protein 2